MGGVRDDVDLGCGTRSSVRAVVVLDRLIDGVSGSQDVFTSRPYSRDAEKGSSRKPVFTPANPYALGRG